MAKDNVVELEGVITKNFPGSEFEVSLTSEHFEGHKTRALLSGKMRMHYIRIVPGDKVKIEFASEDELLERGRITFRYR